MRATMANGYDGTLLSRGDAGYEEARRVTVWNARIPERYPDAIVVAKTEQDVVWAVRDARDRDSKIGVRSGGHSWAGNHVRDGGLLLDVSALREVKVDAETMTAIVGPGCHGDEPKCAAARCPRVSQREVLAHRRARYPGSSRLCCL